MNCVYCESERIVKNGKEQAVGQSIQVYRCKDCRRRFNERSGTPMARLRTDPAEIALAMKMRSEGLGIRATGRVIAKSGGSIINWEQRLSKQRKKWSPTAPAGGEVTLEGDEVYTRVGENLPPLSIGRMDNSLYRTGNSLLDRCSSGTQECESIRARGQSCMGLG
jgi:transposase-like protein